MRIGAIQQGKERIFGLVESTAFRPLLTARGAMLDSLPDATAAFARRIAFSKAPNTIFGPFDAIDAPVDDTSTLDYEGELAVVIGKRCKRATAGNALDYVFGFTPPRFLKSGDEVRIALTGVGELTNTIL
jgi:2-keto-4-pentenoate hydratase/2-oxohepta-3-ene-1,7-dioic acid hydratase in catechol pathway